jgi:DNA-directed RNA polymerase specialized sigma subunit
MNERRNILAARPFFRERQGVFSKGISPSIKKRKFKQLYRFDVNYPFIAFALKVLDWAPRSRVRKAAEAVWVARRELVELNMPLAISQARVFRRLTPESHLAYMDLIQISFEGLINAVDKFVLPYTPVFRSVIIGRCKGDLIEEFSNTMLHFYPSDKRKIYRANKAQKGQVREDVNFAKLAETVNTNGPKLPTPTTASEIQHLVSGSGMYSLDSPAPEKDVFDGEPETLADKYAANMDVQPDVRVEKNEIYEKFFSAINCLNLIECKYVKMKGIEV